MYVVYLPLVIKMFIAYERHFLMFNLFGLGSYPQLIILAVIAFLLFGNRLPSVMRSVGRSVTEFKKGVSGIEDEVDAAVKNTEKKVDTNKDNSEE